MKFSEKLINLRKSKGMSQEDLAEKLNVTRQTISKWELDQTAPDMNKLLEISKLFDVSLDELVKDIEVSNSDADYKESPVEKNNKKIAIRVFIIGIILSLILCGIGGLRQVNAKKTDETNHDLALEQSQKTVNNAQIRLNEIVEELEPLKKEYEDKLREMDSLNMSDSDWFEIHSQLQREANNINSQISTLEEEAFEIKNRDYTVYYNLVKPITYLIFYYIGAGMFAVMSLIALVHFLATRKK